MMRMKFVRCSTIDFLGISSQWVGATFLAILHCPVLVQNVSAGYALVTRLKTFSKEEREPLFHDLSSPNDPISQQII